MYLKSIEMVGFKSFADKTKLTFEPGMTSIVGPNGCGKSNVADAVRWVIGEQSPKAIRGSKMTDVIFNGTDQRKPLGMAEVNVTFGDCEGIIETEYNEITFTRRVFQSGEGQYFINKTPCRLKDIQRTFMDTGIGSSAYSFMQQGRIDQILSSRPEDRREIFEEASGITKFKADKKEALRKLDHTEANLLRLADVIREVKRQIGSLQRQAGKARRYKSVSEELRRLDIYVTRERLRQSDRDLKSLEERLRTSAAAIDRHQQEIAELERDNGALRQSLVHTEREIGEAHEAAAGARGKLEHTRELIDMHTRRIEEYRNMSERDMREIDATRAQAAELAARLEELDRDAETVTAEKEKAGAALQHATETYTAHQRDIDAARTNLQALRDKSVELESQSSRLQNEVAEIEARERSDVIRRERLAAEKVQLTRVSQSYEERRASMRDALAAMQDDVASAEAALSELEERRNTLREEEASLRDAVAGDTNRLAALGARLEMLDEQESAGEGLSEGARRLLDDENPLGIDRDAVLGTLGALIDVDEGYELAAEAALRTWLDAVVVRDAERAGALLRALAQGRAGAARLLHPGAVPPPPALPDGAHRLLDHVRGADGMAPVLAAVAGRVAVVDRLDDAPRPPRDGITIATRDGIVLHGTAGMEYWMRNAGEATPLARRQARTETAARAAALEQTIARQQNRAQEIRAAIEKATAELREAREERDRKRRLLAQKEGEAQVISREAAEAADRLATVTWELESVESENRSGASQKEDLTARLAAVREQRDTIGEDIAAQNRDLAALESRHGELQSELTDRRIEHSEVTQRAAHLAQQRDFARKRLEELEAVAAGRAEGVETYRSGIASLNAAIEEAEAKIGDLERNCEEQRIRAENLSKNREQQATALREMEASLTAKRRELDAAREERSQLDVRRTENQVRRQNVIERITGEYRITLEQLHDEPDPDWKDGAAPPTESLETRIAELRTKMEAMGPVNLVAIEEYKELEERYAFLTEQEQDLVKAKQQLMDMIRRINKTTTELFSRTFEEVNRNFQETFRSLFNGGSARLVLVNEEDVLECGIEIIARPPGKRLQNVSLLSGGERTLTAVALLFAIYMIKPSPFCMLDELDAALDDANIGRFVTILQGFLNQSQFLVITHNRQTIAAADAIYGVTMPEKGVSRLVSMKFRDYEEVPA